MSNMPPDVRFLSLHEMELLQGFKKVKWPQGVAASKRGAMLGNAMSVPVLQSTMLAALRAAGLVKRLCS